MDVFTPAKNASSNAAIVLDVIRHAEPTEPVSELRRQRAQDALEPLGLAPLEPIPGLDDIDGERRARCHLRSLYARWCMVRVIGALDKVFALAAFALAAFVHSRCIACIPVDHSIHEVG